MNDNAKKYFVAAALAVLLAALVTACEPEAKKSESPFISYCGIDGIANRELTTGVPANPIVLATEGDLSLLGCMDGIDRLKASYVLANDITLTKEWEPLGQFTGTLDGGGHSIKNLTINKPSTDYVGLVSGNDGSITNIGIEIGAGGIVGKDNVGAVVGLNKGTVRAVVRGPGSIKGGSYVGGLAGKNEGRLVGVVLADVTGSNSIIGIVGGLAGFTYGNVVGYAEGTVSGGPYVGGVVGYKNDLRKTSTPIATSGYHAKKSVTGSVYVGGGVEGLRGVRSAAMRAARWRFLPAKT